LPLIKRDGGFVRGGYHGELDEMRALRDQSRKVIAGLQRRYADETGVRSLKIKYNNVLGYFIEVTALNAEALTEGDEAKGQVHPPADLANAMRFTTTELSDLESRIANAAGGRWRSSLRPSTRWCRLAVIAAADSKSAAAHALSVIDVDGGLAAWQEGRAIAGPASTTA
jgi:DNA mismatch repair protein MutS